MSHESVASSAWTRHSTGNCPLVGIAYMPGCVESLALSSHEVGIIIHSPHFSDVEMKGLGVTNLP